MDIKGSRTEKNLITAFAGESQARNRYTYAASKAKKEGYVQISDIFTETANQEKEHAKRFFNFLQGGAGVGIRQSLAFGGTAAKVRKARLEHKKLLYLERLAEDGARLEVEKIYRTLREAEANMKAARRAVRATRRWFVSARDSFNAGLEEAGELIDALKEYGIIRAKYLGAIFEHNRTWAALQKATGSSMVAE